MLPRISFSFLSFFFFLVFLGLLPQHVEVRGKSELQLPAYSTATAMPDPSHVCDLHHSSRQRRILNPLSGRPGMEPSPSWILVRFVFAEPRRELIASQDFSAQQQGSWDSLFHCPLHCRSSPLGSSPSQPPEQRNQTTA